MIDGAGLIGTGNLFQIFGADGLKARTASSILVNGTTSVSAAQARNNGVGVYF